MHLQQFTLEDVTRMYSRGSYPFPKWQRKVSVGLCWPQRPEVLDARRCSSEFRSRRVRTECDVISEIHTSWRSQRVRISEDARTHAHLWALTWPHKQIAERGSFSEIFGGLHWFRIVFICRILKFERPLFPSTYTSYTHTRCTVASNVKGRARSVKRTMRVALRLGCHPIPS